MFKHSSLVALGVLVFACSSAPSGDNQSFGEIEPNAGRFGSAGQGSGVSLNLGGGSAVGESGEAGDSSGGPTEELTVETLRKASCAGWSAEPEALPAVLELVVDTSLSMNDQTRATGGRTKWQITREALGRAIEQMPASTALGMLYYPNQRTSGSNTPRDPSACVNVDSMLPVELLGAPGSAERAELASSLQRTSPNGSTPTHDAFHHALVNGLEISKAPGNRFMLLITDGAPTLAQNCLGSGLPQSPSPTQPIIDEVAAARQRGVRTFVIGSPGSEVSVNGKDARPWMSQAATVGGTASANCSDQGPNFCHIDLTQAADFSKALSDALERVAGQVVSCTYALPPPPSGQQLDLSKINVIFTPGDGDPELIGRASDAECKEGYRIDGGEEVTLCSDTCARVQADATASLEVLFGCVSAPVTVR